jgi:uncharacterized protein
LEILRDGGLIVVRLGPGEPVIGSLVTLARDPGLPGATLHAIGAVNHVRLGFFRPEERRYETREFHENLEVLSLIGNLAHGDQGPILHAHASLGRSDLSVIGGHLFEATVSVTLEVFVTPTAARLERSLDPRFDLRLLRLP